MEFVGQSVVFILPINADYGRDPDATVSDGTGRERRRSRRTRTVRGEHV